MRFIHAADIHLDSPLRGLDEYPGAPVERVRGATREALKNLVDLCLAERVDFLVIAGDLFDHDWRDFHTALFVAKEMQRLDAGGIPVFVIFGNHDSVQEMSRRTPWPKNVSVFDHRRPETKRLERCQVAVHGQSFAKREITENLVPDYPEAVPDWFNIGLLHTNANGNSQHDSYAPCSVPELVAKGYDYWALGHVHEFQILHRQPHVIYSGNLQGRHVRETGNKGCVLVTVSDGEVTEIEFRETDVLRWFQKSVALLAEDGPMELQERVRDTLNGVASAADGRCAAVRLQIEGRCQAHRDLVRDAVRQQTIADLRALAGEFGGELWIEEIQFRTRPLIDLESRRQAKDIVGELLREIAGLAGDPQRLRDFAEELKPLEMKVGLDMIDFQNTEQLAAWLRESESLLVNALVEGAE
jgi:DNA repair protein SbcD/Mre11